MDKTLLRVIVEGQNVTLNINAADLKQVLGEMMAEERARAAEEQKRRDEVADLTRDEAAARLRVSLNTLSRWARCGYLIPVKAGRRTLYRASDVNEILTKKGV